MSAIRFMGEQLWWLAIQDICDYDSEKKYVFTISGCKVAFEDFDTFMSGIEWYDPDVKQYLTHDNAGVVTRESPD